jgi:hypothetical protein
MKGPAVMGVIVFQCGKSALPGAKRGHQADGHRRSYSALISTFERRWKL